VIAFSGDKLLGGPQAGIILGKSEFIDRVKSNPLMRALRVDKLTYAALEATINAYARNAAGQEIPVVSTLHTSPEAIRQRARRFVRRAGKLHANLQWKVTPGNSVIGGGCAPETTIPSHLITLTSTRHSAAQLEAHFRQHHLPIITRIVADAVVIDLRTVQPAEEKFILEAAQSLRLPAQL
jgi:L-seryl-tRNA(Ser) seleniumtransferase